MRNSKKEDLKKYYIKMVHVLKKNFFLDEECRYVYMEAKFGKNSLKDLTIDELRIMLDELGYQSKKRFKKGNLKTEKAVTKKYLKATQAQIDTIVAIWNTVARVKTRAALGSFIERITGNFPLYLSHLNKDEASNVIVALKKLQDDFFKKDSKNKQRQINKRVGSNKKADIIASNNIEFRKD